jgi:hypothetical protein
MHETEVIKKHMTEFASTRVDLAHGADLAPPPPFEWTP